MKDMLWEAHFRVIATNQAKNLVSKCASIVPSELNGLDWRVARKTSSEGF
jgi:hypothetical protein